MMRAVRATCALLCAIGMLQLTVSVSARTTSLPFSAASLELPRSLADSNAALDAARTLRTEMDALATQTAGLTRDARVNFRRVAFDLLFHGAAAPFDSQAMVIAGLRMAAARTELDQTLNNPLATEVVRKGVDRKTVDEALLRFVQASANGLEPLPAPDHPEVTLAPMFLPLEQAVAMLDSRTPAPSPTAWPARIDFTLGTTGTAATAATAATERDPNATFAAATWIDPETRQALAAAFQRARGARDASSMQAITECTRAIEAGTALANQPDGWTTNAVCQGLRALAGAFNRENAQRLADAVAAEVTCVTFDPTCERVPSRTVFASRWSCLISPVVRPLTLIWLSNHCRQMLLILCELAPFKGGSIRSARCAHRPARHSNPSAKDGRPPCATPLAGRPREMPWTCSLLKQLS